MIGLCVGHTPSAATFFCMSQLVAEAHFTLHIICGPGKSSFPFILLTFAFSSHDRNTVTSESPNCLHFL
jgi:hypothetical protein